MIAAPQYRAWVDENNIGHIRVLKRMKFILLLSIIRDVVLMQSDTHNSYREIYIYVPESLSGIKSDNFFSFIEFTQVCCNISIIVIDNPTDGQ